MRRRPFIGALAALVCVLAAVLPAAAQQAGPSPGFRVFVLYDSHSMRASETFEAVLGDSRLPAVGGGGELLRIWKGLFARVAASAVEERGTRVFVFDGQVFPLDIPLTVEILPIEISAGWRFEPRALRPLALQAGGGLLRTRYRERAAFATEGDDVNRWLGGYQLFGGVDVTIFKGLLAGVEGQYRAVPDAFGSGGVAGEFGENDLGGATFRVVIGFRR